MILRGRDADIVKGVGSQARCCKPVGSADHAKARNFCHCIEIFLQTKVDESWGVIWIYILHGEEPLTFPTLARTAGHLVFIPGGNGFVSKSLSMSMSLDTLFSFWPVS